MSISTIILILLILLLIGSFPGFAHSKSWGYRPFGIIGVILVIVLVLVLLGKI